MKYSLNPFKWIRWLWRFFPTIDFVGEIPQNIIDIIPDATKENLAGCYIKSSQSILILRGRGFKKTLRTVLHELGHWGIELLGGRQKCHGWFDKRFTSKEF